MVLKVLIFVWLFFNSPQTQTEWLTYIINAECGICTKEEKYLVGSVVLNRVEAKSFPNTIEQVITQHRQFDGYESVHFRWGKQSENVAKDLLKGKGRTYKILYFVNESISHNKKFINFVKGSPNYIIAHNHIFG